MQYVPWNKVNFIEVPHVQGLRIPEILEFAGKHWKIEQNIPDYETDKYPSSKWIWNVGKLFHKKIKYSEFFH